MRHPDRSHSIIRSATLRIERHHFFTGSWAVPTSGRKIGPPQYRANFASRLSTQVRYRFVAICRGGGRRYYDQIRQSRLPRLESNPRNLNFEPIWQMCVRRVDWRSGDRAMRRPCAIGSKYVNSGDACMYYKSRSTTNWPILTCSCSISCSGAKRSQLPYSAPLDRGVASSRMEAVSAGAETCVLMQRLSFSATAQR
jgi:hypothetical protein